MNRNERLLELLTHFNLQVDEVAEALKRAIDKRLLTINQRLFSSIQSSMGQLTRRNLPILASNGLVAELQGLVQDINESLLELILAASRALPQFIRHSGVNNESLDLSLLDPFGLTDLGRDSNTFTIAADVLGITEDEARELFAELLLFGLGLSDVWQIFLIRQRDQLRQRLAQILSEIPDDTQAIQNTVMRDVQRTLSDTLNNTSSQTSASYVAKGVATSVLIDTVNKIVQQIANKNQEVFSGEYLWVAILDAVTCKRCAGLNGKRFQFGSGPLPQLHPWCRCFVMPILKGVGPVSIQDFNEWLRKQNSQTQDSILGKRGAELFRQGKVKFRDFIDFRNRVKPRERTIDAVERIARR